MLPVKLSTVPRDEQTDEDNLQRVVFDILERIDRGSEQVPAMYEGMKCYQFEIEVKKPARQAHARTGSSFFGELVKKFTNN